MADILGQDDSEDSFENHLQRKSIEWQNPLDSPTNVHDVVVSLSSGQNSQDETGPSIPSESAEPVDAASQEARDIQTANRSAQMATERETQIHVHKHPVAGTYITESTVEFTVDDEFLKLRSESRSIGVTEMTSEAIIDRYHKLERQLKLIKYQQMGLRDALEELLKAETYGERQRILELDRKYMVQARKSDKPKKDKAPSKNQGEARIKALVASGFTEEQARTMVLSGGASSSSSSSKTESLAPTTAGQKAARKLFDLKFNREVIEQHLTTQKLLDDSTKLYLDKLYSQE